MMRYPIFLILKGAADGGLCSAYGAGIGVGNGDAGGSDGDMFSDIVYAQARQQLQMRAAEDPMKHFSGAD